MKLFTEWSGWIRGSAVPSIHTTASPGICRQYATVSRKSKWLFSLAVLIALLSPMTSYGAGAQLRAVAVITGDELMGTLNEPSAMFYDEAKKRLYVADSVGDRLVSFDSTFKFLSELTDASFALPLGVVKGLGGEFLITDGKNGELKMIDTRSMQVKPLLVKNMPAARNRFIPGRLTADRQGNLYVIDRLNRSILILSSDGTFLRAIKVKKRGFYGFDDLRVDDKGFVYAVDAVGASVYVFNNKGKLVSSFGARGKNVLEFPVSIAVDRAGENLYVLDRHRGVIMVFGPKGGFKKTLLKKGVKVGELYSPSYVYLDDAGRIFTIDGRRIQVFEFEDKK